MFGKRPGSLGVVRLRTPIQRAIAILRRFGSNAHVYLPGVGVMNGLQTGNYLESTGVTPGAVDQPVGLALSATSTGNASQATAANRPILRRAGLGPYSWQFDGVNDSLSLGAPLFQMADDHCVIVGAMCSSAASYSAIACPSGTDGNNAACQIMVEATSGKAYVEWKGGGVTSTCSSPSSVVGSNFVVSGRKVSATKTARLNGVAIGSPQSANTNGTALTAGFIGRSPTGDFHIGNIYPVIAIKGTVTDADLLLLEKLVGSLSGVAIP